MKGKKKKLIPDSTIKREMDSLKKEQNLTPFRSNGTSEHGVRRRLFTEENRHFGYCVAITLPFLAVGVYATLALLGYGTNFDLFVATGIFAAVALLCFCSIKLLMCNSKKKNDNTEEEKRARAFSNIEFSTIDEGNDLKLGKRRCHTI